MSGAIDCNDTDGTEDRSEVSISHWCNNCEEYIFEWSEKIRPSKSTLLTKLRDEVVGLDRYYSGNEGLLFLDATGHVVLFADVLALIADIEKGGE